MKNRLLCFLFISCSLTGCVPPATTDTPPPYPGVITRDDVADARSACMADARRQGRDHVRVENARYLGGTNYEVRLSARGPYGPEKLFCSYNAEYRTTSIDFRSDAPRDRDIYAEARGACVAEVRSRGRDITDVDRPQHLGGPRYRVMIRTRGPHGPERASCAYDAQYRTTSIDFRSDAPRDRDIFAEARSACVAEVRSRGRDVNDVERPQHLGGPRYRVTIRARGPHGPEHANCVYDAQHRTTSIDFRPEPSRDYLHEARNACVSEARRRGMNVLGVESTSHLGGPRYKVRLRCRQTHSPFKSFTPDCFFNGANGSVTIH